MEHHKDADLIVPGQRQPTAADLVLALAQSKELSSQRDLGAQIKALLCGGGESLGQGGFGNGQHFEGGPCVWGLQDELPWDTQGLGENGAQALMALDQVAQRSLQS